MKRIALGCVVTCLLLSVPPLFAKTGERIELPMREADASVVVDGMRINVRTGAPEALYRPGDRLEGGTPEEMVREYLEANAGLLRLADPLLGDLEYLETRENLVGQTVRFRQHVDGVPVLGGRIAVTIDHEGVVVFVANEYRPDVELAETVPILSAAEARQKALEVLGPAGPLAHDETTLAIDYDRGVSTLAWQSRIVPSGTPFGDWDVRIDARTGDLLLVADRAAYDGEVPVDGTGNVFDPDPLSTAGATYGDTGFVDGGDAATAQLDGELLLVTLPDIDLTAGIHSLDGPRTRIVDVESPFKGLFSQAGSFFDFDRSDDGFEAVNTYYHVDHYMAYLNETLGLGVLPSLNGGVVQFDPHGLGGDDNSHYISSTELIAFGEGGVDDAEDADVVIHELGHGLHDWAAGCISQSNGLSEGIGDYAAVEYSRSVDVWLPSDPQYNWVFSWDGHNSFWSGRVTNWTDTHTWPSGTGGSCLHTCGQYWASSMMDIYDAIGRDATARAHWTGIGMLGCSATHVDAANAVIQAAIGLGYSAADVLTIYQIFAATGYPVDEPDVGTIFVDGFESGDTSLWTVTFGGI